VIGCDLYGRSNVFKEETLLGCYRIMCTQLSCVIPQFWKSIMKSSECGIQKEEEEDGKREKKLHNGSIVTLSLINVITFPETNVLYLVSRGVKD
jgi:hypothetical protein